jgi:hypothetical protein
VEEGDRNPSPNETGQGEPQDLRVCFLLILISALGFPRIAFSLLFIVLLPKVHYMYLFTSTLIQRHERDRQREREREKVRTPLESRILFMCFCICIWTWTCPCGRLRSSWGSNKWSSIALSSSGPFSWEHLSLVVIILMLNDIHS